LNTLYLISAVLSSKTSDLFLKQSLHEGKQQIIKKNPKRRRQIKMADNDVPTEDIQKWICDFFNKFVKLRMDERRPS